MKSIYSPDAPAPVGPYSQAIESGGFLFVSGQLPIDPKDSKLRTASVEEQTKTALENLRSVLAASGLTLSQVVKTTVFMTDLTQFDTMNRVYESYFSAPYPARSCVQVQALPKGAGIEIEAIVRQVSVREGGA